MHPALMIAVMEERDREIARRTKNAWRQPSHSAHPPKPHRSRGTGRSRLSAAVGRLAFFG